MGDRLRVCVLTGDPRLPDLTKRDHRYHEEDFATHRAMREALESLPGFRFEFLDDHEALIQRLADDPPDLVVNFLRRLLQCRRAGTAHPRVPLDAGRPL